ncbi:hypothetical protein K1719_037757 [Acacia pycnantha]|nr:hypothetical protein K1719_037757 [Acacia pycnantha]
MNNLIIKLASQPLLRRPAGQESGRKKENAPFVNKSKKEAHFPKLWRSTLLLSNIMLYCDSPISDSSNPLSDAFSFPRLFDLHLRLHFESFSDVLRTRGSSFGYWFPFISRNWAVLVDLNLGDRCSERFNQFWMTLYLLD